MASFTTQVCDRCKAHFPLKELHIGERPVHKIKADLYGRMEEYEVCSACRKELYDIFKKFMKENNG